MIRAALVVNEKARTMNANVNTNANESEPNDVEVRASAKHAENQHRYNCIIRSSFGTRTCRLQFYDFTSSKSSNIISPRLALQTVYVYIHTGYWFRATRALARVSTATDHCHYHCHGHLPQSQGLPLQHLLLHGGLRLHGGGRGGGRGGGGWDQFAVGPQQILLIARHVNTYVSYPPLLM